MTTAQTLYGGSAVALVGNTDLTILSSAERIATVNSDEQLNYHARGAIVTVDVDAVEGTPSIVAKVQHKAAVGEWRTLLESDPITEPGTHTFIVYPGVGAAGGDVDKVAGYPLSKTWRVRVEHADADPITYSVSATVVQ